MILGVSTKKLIPENLEKRVTPYLPFLKEKEVVGVICFLTGRLWVEIYKHHHRMNGCNPVL